MEVIEELSAGSNDLSMIMMKGKRTKRRHRPLSPVSSQPSSSSSGAGGGGGGGCYVVIPYPTTTSTSDISTTDHQDEDDDDDEDDQDQDIANCLILLAQGDIHIHQSSRKESNFNQEEPDVADGVVKMEKLSSSSRRFTEMVTSTTGSKVGFFVYECKTCNRTFPSFQALGGHRASHRKPKAVMPEEKLKSAAINEDHHHQEEEEVAADHHHQEMEVIKEELTQVQVPEPSSSSSKCKAKNHECSICGAEFSSGQALGGHMRRHRNPPPAAMNTAKVSMVVDQTSPVGSIQEEDVDEESHAVKKKQRINNNRVFQLDLNLPAPIEEDHHHHIHRDLKFQQQKQQQQHHLVFSATPALIDCHY